MGNIVEYIFSLMFYADYKSFPKLHRINQNTYAK